MTSKPASFPLVRSPATTGAANLLAHAGAVLTTARRLLPDEGAARTVAADVLKAAAAQPEPRVQSLDSWLRDRVIASAIAAQRAGAAAEPRIEDLLPRFQADGHHVRVAPSSARTAAAIQAAIRRLPVEHRLVVLLHDAEGLAHGTVAALLGASVDVVRRRLHEARLALCEFLVDDPVNAGSP